MACPFQCPRASEGEAEPIERHRHLRGGGGGHGIDADQRNLAIQHQSVAAVVRDALDIAGELNEQGNWQGAMRFLDKAGAPVTKLKIKLSP